MARSLFFKRSGSNVRMAYVLPISGSPPNTNRSGMYTGSTTGSSSGTRTCWVLPALWNSIVSSVSPDTSPDAVKRPASPTNWATKVWSRRVLVRRAVVLASTRWMAPRAGISSESRSSMSNPSGTVSTVFDAKPTATAAHRDRIVKGARLDRPRGVVQRQTANRAGPPRKQPSQGAYPGDQNENSHGSSAHFPRTQQVVEHRLILVGLNDDGDL